MKVGRKFKAWRQAVRDLAVELDALQRKHCEDHASVAPEDWDKLVKGHERKVQTIFGRKFPRTKWPAGIPYLNMIALRQHVDIRKGGNVSKALAPKKVATEKLTSRKNTLTKIAPNGSALTKMTTKRTSLTKTAVEKHTPAPAPSLESKAAETSTQESPLSVQAQILRLEREYEQSRKQLQFIIKIRRDPTSVSFKQWQDAVQGTNVAQVDRRIAGYMELARRRAVGEECDGWAYGMFFGP